MIIKKIEKIDRSEKGTYFSIIMHKNTIKLRILHNNNSDKQIMIMVCP